MSTAAKVLSPFLAFIFAVLLPIFVIGQGEVVNSRIVTEPTLLYFHFLGRPERDVIGHVNIRILGNHFR